MRKDPRNGRSLLRQRKKRHWNGGPCGKKGGDRFREAAGAVGGKRGCGLTQINAGKIIQLCGDDLLTLSSELEKAVRLGSGPEITKDDIDLLVAKNRKLQFLLWAARVMAGNYDKDNSSLTCFFIKRGARWQYSQVLSSNYEFIPGQNGFRKRRKRLPVLSKRL